jgi:hypothetical protein
VKALRCAGMVIAMCTPASLAVLAAISMSVTADR